MNLSDSAGLEEKIKQVENQLEQLRKENIIDPSLDDGSTDVHSRRDFLKKAVGGVAGLGAAAMIPSAAGFRINSDRGFSLYNQTGSNPNFEIDAHGDLDLKDNNISNVGSLNVEELSNAELNGATRIRPSDDLTSLIKAASKGETIVVEPGSHDLTDTVYAKDGQTFVIRGDITARAGSSDNVKDGFMIKGTSSDYVEDVTVIYQGGSMTADPIETTRPLMEASYAKRCRLINAKHYHSGNSLTFWGRAAVNNDSEDMWVIGGRFANSGQNNPPLDWAGDYGGGVIGATCIGGGKEGINFINGHGSVLIGCTFKDVNTSGTGGDGIAVSNAENCTIANNTIDNRGAATDGGIAITGGDTKNCVIANNVICNLGRDDSVDKAHGYGIRARGGGGNNLYQGNLIENVYRGINTSAKSDPEQKFIGNSICNITEIGIYTEGQRTSILSNHIRDIGQDGIVAPNPSDVVVAYNWVNQANTDDNGYTGIRFPDKGGTSGGRTVCAHNLIVGDAGSFPDIGIRDSTSGDVGNVVGNVVTDKGSQAFSLTGNYSRVANNTPAAPVDVRYLRGQNWNVGFHNGNGSNTVGPAFYDGKNKKWVSTVDGTDIT